MGPVDATIGWGLAVAVTVLSLVGAGFAWLGRLDASRAILLAVVRAVVQLAAVSGVLVLVLRSPWWTSLFIAVMVVVATVTSSRRVDPHDRARPWPSLAIAAGALPALGLAVAVGAIPRETVAVLPIAGILIGGAMTATSLAGRRAAEQLHDRWGEYEAALSIGLVPRAAVQLLIRPAVSLALVPAIDQTRTVGLVTLPGAFVGVLLGGGTPLQAGGVQLLVLVGILAAQAVAVVVTTELVSADPSRLGPRPGHR